MGTIWNKTDPWSYPENLHSGCGDNLWVYTTGSGPFVRLAYVNTDPVDGGVVGSISVDSWIDFTTLDPGNLASYDWTGPSKHYIGEAMAYTVEDGSYEQHWSYDVTELFQTYWDGTTGLYGFIVAKTDYIQELVYLDENLDLRACGRFEPFADWQLLFLKGDYQSPWRVHVYLTDEDPSGGSIRRDQFHEGQNHGMHSGMR